MIKEATTPHAALLLRVSLGVILLAHAGLQIFVFTILGFVGNFGSIGLPAIVAYAGWENPALWAVGLVVLYLLGDGAMALKPTPAKSR